MTRELNKGNNFIYGSGLIGSVPFEDGTLKFRYSDVPPKVTFFSNIFILDTNKSYKLSYIPTGDETVGTILLVNLDQQWSNSIVRTYTILGNRSFGPLNQKVNHVFLPSMFALWKSAKKTASIIGPLVGNRFGLWIGNTHGDITLTELRLIEFLA
jgi:hypothetical protein